MEIPGHALKPITKAIRHHTRNLLPTPPPVPGCYVVSVAELEAETPLVEVVWVASYMASALRPAEFAGWTCLNPLEEASP